MYIGLGLISCLEIEEAAKIVYLCSKVEGWEKVFSF